MDYKKHYQLLINKGKNRNISGYVEVHHIIPVCIGGTDDKENLVKLTPEEHYLAHQLLVKIYPCNDKLTRAAIMMIPNRPSNKLYGWLKRKFSIAQSVLQTGTNNSQYGRVWIYSDELMESTLIDADEPIPNGWKLGRKINFTKNFCKECNIEIFSKLEYCSDKCKCHNRSPAIKIIDNNLELILEKYKTRKSITSILKDFGISGRQGNGYLSKILKDNGFTVLKRRNSAE